MEMSQLTTPVHESIRVLIADADAMSAHLIADELTRGRHDISVVAVSNTCAETIYELDRKQPDIAVINAHLDDGPLAGYRVLQHLQLLSHKTVAIMMIPDSERDLVIDAFRGGARGVFCRIQPVKLLSKCIRTVREGQVWADSQNLHFVLEFLTRLKPLRQIKQGGGMNRLTPREAEVVQLLAEGMSTKEISFKLKVTDHTIRNYLSNVYDKLGVSSRVELALYAVTREELHNSPGI
jgi:two-component system nitrate/nitrite response regulator NarL